MFAQLRYPASIFYVVNLLGLSVIHVSSTGPIPMRIAGLYLFGFAVGFCIQILVREAVPLMRIGMASFWAAFTLWLPIVLVTYGFALMGIPLLVAYGRSSGSEPMPRRRSTAGAAAAFGRNEASRSYG